MLSFSLQLTAKQIDFLQMLKKRGNWPVDLAQFAHPCGINKLIMKGLIVHARTESGRANGTNAMIRVYRITAEGRAMLKLVEIDAKELLKRQRRQQEENRE